MATTTIEQKPLFNRLAVGQDIIFVVSNNTVVANQTKVKFCAEVWISDENNQGLPPLAVASNMGHKIGTFKVSPNGAGVGIFDFRNILENYVKADHLAFEGSAYKLITTTEETSHPIHLIDKFSGNNNSYEHVAFKFFVEYLDNNQYLPDGATANPSYNLVITGTGTEQLSEGYQIFNGYIKYSDILKQTGKDFGYDTSAFEMNTVTTGKFLSNAPTTQYANLEDYGTFAVMIDSQALTLAIDNVYVEYFNSSGVSLGTDEIERTDANGAYTSTFSVFTILAQRNILFCGLFPGNLRNWSTTFRDLITAGTIKGGYYTIKTRNSSNVATSDTYTINLNCPNQKQFESIRLCWLNQWGAWDYYTFVQKSITSITSSGSTYNQLEGTWNESTYRPYGYKGGKKAFRVNANEKITMNTDFVSENDNVMFEELINSPEVYMLKGYNGDVTESGYALNQYVTPVRLMTSTFTKKTIANDKLIQYTFEVEKSKTLRTQAI